MFLAELYDLHLQRKPVIGIHFIRFIESLVIDIFVNNRTAADVALSVFECFIST
jgi:hypothetical protein